MSSATVEMFEDRANNAATVGIECIGQVKDMLMSVSYFDGSVKVAMLRSAIVKMEEACKRLEYAGDALAKAIERSEKAGG